ncbi:MAG: hypothetical protein ACR2KZ_09990 [Segetibacter sp.]
MSIENNSRKNDQEYSQQGLPSNEAFPPTLGLLVDFDYSIAERVQSITEGNEVNGHNPNGNLTEALTENIVAQKELIEEYRWALMLMSYRYKDSEEQETLLAAAEDGLFIAAETFNPTQEPNFLTHLQTTLQNYLGELFDSSPIAPHISLDQFDFFITEQQKDPYPTLAEGRQAEDFKAGEKVLLLMNDSLVPAEVKLVKAYSSRLTVGPAVELSPEQLASRQAALDERRAELKAKRASSPKERLIKENLMPDSETLRLKIAMSGLFQQVITNPSPGFLRLSTLGQADFIIDIDSNWIIQKEAWQRITKDPAYCEAWLGSGSVESTRERERLLAAIKRFEHEESCLAQKRNDAFKTSRARSRVALK